MEPVISISLRSDGTTSPSSTKRVIFTPGTKARAMYGKDVVAERHRHRYEFNNHYLNQLEAAGLIISAKSMDDSLVEMIELPNHPWFVACQAHPEFLSTPRDGHPLFIGFISAAREYKQSRSGVSREQAPPDASSSATIAAKAAPTVGAKA